MNLLEETKFILKKYGIRADKSLGQNFLINEDVVNSIVNSSNINKEDLIIEIGPGLGTLTSFLLEKAGKVIAVELDKRMIEILTDRFKLYNNFKLINDDILKVNLNEVIGKNLNETIKNVKIVANLPYYITTPIIEKITTLGLVKGMTLLVQKEVGERFLASNGTSTYGYFTAYLNYFYDMKKVIDVSRDKFNPSPKVDSMVVKFISNIKENLDFESFNRFLKKCFINKRKTLRNNLGIDLELYGYKNTVRAEELSIYDLIDLFKKIK